MSPPHPLTPSHPPTLPPSLWSQVSVQHLLPHIQYYTCHPLPPSPPPPSPCSQVSHPLMMVGRTVTKSRLVNGGRSAVPMVLNFGGSESSSQGLLLTHLTTSTLAHLHHTHNCTTQLYNCTTHTQCDGSAHSSGCVVNGSNAYYYYHTHTTLHTHVYTQLYQTHTICIRTHSNTLIRRYTYTHTLYLTYSTTHSHPHTPLSPSLPTESGDPRNVERPGCQPQMAPHNNMICTTKVRKTHQHNMHH